MAFVEINNISKSFLNNKSRKIIKVLDNISFMINKGEFVSVLGPTGCGKTTLLKIVDNLEIPDSGHVCINQKVVKQPGLDRGFVFQEFHLLPWRSILGNVLFGLENIELKSGERKKTALKYLEMVGLLGLENNYPHQLSGGEKQRVGLARALAITPNILLMDEPLGSIDEITKLSLEKDFHSILKKIGATILIVTHNIDEAVYLSDKAIVMSPKPSKIIKEFKIDLGKERTDQEIRTSENFINYKKEILNLLNQNNK